MENSNISWTHNTQNFWLGCDRIAPEYAHCYIGRTLRQQGREPCGQLYRTKTWKNPAKWQKLAEARGVAVRLHANPHPFVIPALNRMATSILFSSDSSISDYHFLKGGAESEPGFDCVGIHRAV